MKNIVSIMLEYYQNPNINSGLIHSPHEHLFTSGSNGQTDVGIIKCEKNFEICEGCGQKIEDKYIMRIADDSYHEQCLICCECGVTLNRRCYKKHKKIYCKSDYDKLFCTKKCDRCNDIILPTDLVMRVQNYYFHLQCFACYLCGQRLQKGDEYIVRVGGRLICKHDLENELYTQHYADEYMIEETIRHKDGRRGPKRPRTILTSAQRRQFKASFEMSPKPCRKIREALAKDTGLSVRVVQVWFQNQRAKMKKIQRKSKHDGDKNGDKDKDEKGIKQESLDSEHGLYVDGSFNSSSQPLNPNTPFSPDHYQTNSNDSICSSDISLDDSQFDQFDDEASDTVSVHNLQLHHHSYPHHGQNNNNNLQESLGSLSGSIINPIDKLYLMQNSYFNEDH